MTFYHVGSAAAGIRISDLLYSTQSKWSPEQSLGPDVWRWTQRKSDVRLSLGIVTVKRTRIFYFLKREPNDGSCVVWVACLVGLLGNSEFQGRFRFGAADDSSAGQG